MLYAGRVQDSYFSKVPKHVFRGEEFCQVAGCQVVSYTEAAVESILDVLCSLCTLSGCDRGG